jgi:hypothetical protein
MDMKKTFDVLYGGEDEDADTKQLSMSIKSTIERIQNRPELSGCEDAFERILNKVDNGKIGVVDDSTVADEEVSDQFRKIIKFFQMETQGKSQDPKMS